MNILLAYYRTTMYNLAYHIMVYQIFSLITVDKNGKGGNDVEKAEHFISFK